MTTIPRVLAVAGTDPTGGAGIHADLKSIAANGGYGMAAVTALVAQNTRGVRSVHVPPAAFLTEQLDAVSDDVAIDAVKIGMLATAEIIEAVGAWLDRVRPPVMVLDPVMVATSGDRLLDEDTERALRALIGRVDLITPNVPELAVLANEEPAMTWPDVLAQARRVSASYAVVVLAKSGHLAGEAAPDALVDATGALSEGREVVEFPGRRIETTNTHGTGCSLSSALATWRPVTSGWEQAAALSKRWLSESIAHGTELRVGTGHGPVSHFAGLWSRGGTRTPATAEEVVADWWRRIDDIRTRIDETPFVRGLAAGSLDRGVFVWYLAQDALYLRDYSRALAEASRLAPTTDEQFFWATAAHASVTTELLPHAAWLPTGHVYDAQPSRTTTAYLNHLLATASRADYAVLVAALLPCFWIYVDVGSRLHQSASAEHPYLAWLETYADADFEAAARRAIDIVGECAAHADGTTQHAMWQAFRASAEHELEFFACWSAPSAMSS